MKQANKNKAGRHARTNTRRREKKYVHKMYNMYSNNNNNNDVLDNERGFTSRKRSSNKES